MRRILFIGDLREHTRSSQRMRELAELGHEATVFVGDRRFDLGAVVAFGHAGWDHEVDAVGQVAELGVHAGQPGLDLVGCASGGAPDADAAMTADRDRGVE